LKAAASFRCLIFRNTAGAGISGFESGSRPAPSEPLADVWGPDFRGSRTFCERCAIKATVWEDRRGPFRVTLPLRPKTFEDVSWSELITARQLNRDCEHLPCSSRDIVGVAGALRAGHMYWKLFLLVAGFAQHGPT
jgi:hypothetical protein